MASYIQIFIIRNRVDVKMNKNLAFWDNCLGERGTTVSLYDYAYYNKHLLQNSSFIFYDKNNSGNNLDVINKFEKEFPVFAVEDFTEVDEILSKERIEYIYIIKSGERDSRISSVAKNCIHCVFNCHQPHGDVYSSIAPWVQGNNGQYPVVPHMINLPKHENNLRESLGIPRDAIVFGGYGGRDNFSIGFAQQTVDFVSQKNDNIFFLFANFDRFCKERDNIIHLPTTVNLDEKVSFINTCDAMLWARADGEVMSLSMGEFSSMNKPIICMNIGYDGHVHLLKDKAIWYSNKEELLSILLNFNPKEESKKDWNAYKEYTPEKVMKTFEETYLRQNNGQYM